MKTMGQAGLAMPRAKPGDFERALQLLASVADSKSSKMHLQELRDATAAEVDRREEVEFLITKAKERDETARQAEADAAHARQVLGDETAAASAKLDTRERAVGEREKAVGEREAFLDKLGQDVDRRVKLLRAAGVVLGEQERKTDDG